MKKSLKIILLSSLVLGAGSTAFLATSRGLVNLRASECTHEYGNHYAKKDSDAENSGYVEHWVCCNCHEVLLTQPTSGNWTDQTELQYSMEATNLAYVTPFTGSRNVIGYKVALNGKTEVATSTIKMANADISIGKAGVSAGDYGMTGTSGEGADFVDTEGTKEGNTGYTNSIGYCTNTDEASIKSVVLPRVNYGLFDEVTFSFGSCAADGWGQIGMGILEEGDLFAKANHGAQATFKIVVQKQTVDSLSITAKVSDGTENTVNVSDIEDIVNGVDNLPLTMYGGKYRCIYLRSVCVGHDTGAVSNSTDVIGYKNQACSVCGKVTGASKEVMTSADVDYSKAIYGAYLEDENHTRISGGAQHSTPIGDYANKLDNALFIGQNGNFYKLRYGFMPRINFALYSKVEFAVRTSNAYSFNFDGAAWADPCGGAKDDYTLEIVNNGENDLTLTFTKDGGTPAVTSITSEDIYNGVAGIPFYFGASEWYTGGFFSLPTLTVK